VSVALHTRGDANRIAEALTNFPLCILHNVRLVDRFPRGCPLGQPDIGAALNAFYQRGWQRIIDHHRGGGDDLARHEICSNCPARTHRRVRYLRETEGLNDA